MSSTYKYRLLKSMWGIRIDITAEVSYTICGEDREVSNNLYMYVHRRLGLNEYEKENLIKGLRLVSDQISTYQPTPQPIVICILDIWFNECDYQAEGLVCAIAGWAAQEFGFEPVHIPVTFDRQNNRYSFDFSETQTLTSKQET